LKEGAMTRRDFCIRVGALPAALPFTAAAAGRGIDQNPIRRKGVGLRGWNRAQASPGLTLFTPMNGEGTVYLMDLNGKIGHTWEMPYPPGLYGYLTERGTLFYNGKIPTDSFLGRTLFKGGVALEATGTARFSGRFARPIIITMDAC
jgi:hypothetical protein